MKKICIVVTAAAVVSASASVSTLSVYQDRSIYSYLPASTFIGLTKNITAKCKGESVPLRVMQICPPSARLCNELYTKIESTQTKIRENRLNSEILEKLITLPKPDSLDAQKAIAAAQAVAKEQTKLVIEKEKATRRLKELKSDLSRQARATRPVGLKKECNGTVTLEIPYGYVTFETEYTAILLDENRIKVQLNLSIRNHSGIDIDANQATFYYRPSQQYVRPVHFRPWVVREQKPFPQKRLLQKTVAANRHIAGNIAPVAATPMQAHYKRSREYSVKNLKLPSDGEAKKIPVMQWEVPVKCQIRLYAYRNPHAYKVCTFSPKFQIEHNRWKIYQGGDLINEKAVGEYEEGSYRLYVSNDEDLKIERKPVIDKEKESGIFGGTIKKRDGFSLQLTNTSEKSKKVVVTERIPTSATDKIKVRLLSVTGNSYKLRKNGKIEMEVSLPPKSHKRIEVLFEISYDKDLKVMY